MKTADFNDGWLFKRAIDKEWQEVYLPHDAMMYEGRFREAPSGAGGGYYRGGRYLYKKTFKADYLHGKNVFLYFGGVFGECFVSVNGKLMANNKYGYSSFYADLSEAIDFKRDNEIEVEVNNDKIPNSRWYTGSGIYRSVKLVVGGDVCVAPRGLRISTPEVSKEVSRLEISLKIHNNREETFVSLIETEVTDHEGNTVCRETTPFSFFEKGNFTARQNLYLKNVKLWSVDYPYLYDCRIRLLNENREVADETHSFFGIREITVDPVNGLRLNGKTLLLRGACIHHDNGVIGACEYYDACERRVRILKDAGFNAVRISHHPCSEEMLEACDRLGMLVWDETFDMWHEAKTKYDFSMYFIEEWKGVVDNMVEKDYNHPCVFMYSIGNEIPETVKPNGVKISRMISGYIREKDDTRLVTNAINGMCAASGQIVPLLIDMGVVTKEQIASITGNPDSDSASVFNVILQAAATGGINDAMTALSENMGRVMEHPSIGEKLSESLSHLDVCGYNYMKSRYEIDARDHPNRIIVGSETVPPDIDLIWGKVKKIPQLIGDFTWTGWDYIGEAGVGHTNYEGKREFAAAYPGFLAYCGDIDITGYRRPMSYLREIVYGIRKKPYISVQNPLYYNLPAKTTSWAEPETAESWTWPSYEGKPVRVKVYSCDEEVALLINGVEIGRKKAERNRASFEIRYQPGELKAVGYTGGKRTESFSVYTASEHVGLTVNCSKERLKCGKDLCFIEMQFADKNGVKVFNSDTPIKISVSENAQLIGFGSADPKTEEEFFYSVRTPFNGRALAVVRGTKKGAATITITCGNEMIKRNILID